MSAVPGVPRLAAVDQALAEHAPLPRDNGELVFEEPWQGRALGMGVVLLERTGTSWAEFRRHLVAAIERRPPRQRRVLEAGCPEPVDLPHACPSRPAPEWRIDCGGWTALTPWPQRRG